ncbi:hypothetical protein B0J12DRAFT_692612 [Macrophomina phaseolina]|uniref:Secreted peptide n=1 Tax=Macrophomina phaseolina TaxID=35725 RepID=A0ABQ8FPB4_9PEZI|nr:hypothetical protein B0J12DRAFT_692612 [Macrophomina phaseolina]
MPMPLPVFVVVVSFVSQSMLMPIYSFESVSVSVSSLMITVFLKGPNIDPSMRLILMVPTSPVRILLISPVVPPMSFVLSGWLVHSLQRMISIKIAYLLGSVTACISSHSCESWSRSMFPILVRCVLRSWHATFLSVQFVHEMQILNMCLHILAVAVMVVVVVGCSKTWMRRS